MMKLSMVSFAMNGVDYDPKKGSDPFISSECAMYGA